MAADNCMAEVEAGRSCPPMIKEAARELKEARNAGGAKAVSSKNSFDASFKDCLF